MWWRRPYVLASAVTVVFVVLFFWNMRRDLTLSELPPEAMTEVPVEVEDLEMTRSVGDKLWHITAVKVQRYSQEDRMEGIVSDLTGPDGVRNLWAPVGRYLPEVKELELDQPKGDWIREIHPFTWEGPRALWRQREDLWIFPEGIVVRGDTFALVGDRAEMRSQRQVRVEGGTLRWWSDQ